MPPRAGWPGASTGGSAGEKVFGPEYLPLRQTAENPFQMQKIPLENDNK
ncbi:MAG: hypothetical protein M0P92_06300 [Acholeplasmataceae bacterium]|nr:hypothetical protein [Acholeplasmataceae bacterium]